jgi:endoglucanase
MLLEKLCNADGVSGDEGRIRDIIKSEIAPYADDIQTDRLGNLIVFKKGKNSSRKIMLCAHMDEVGFIVSKITEKGYIKFKKVGGIDNRVILGKKVRFANGVKGIIGVKAVHLLSKEELKSVPKATDLYIDIGADSEEEAKKYVSVADYAVFDTEFEKLGDTKYKGKAFDDRVGCAVLAEAMKHENEFDTYFCFTTQEEVGLRGSIVAAERIKPDVALVLESTTCADVYKTELHERVTVCGKGPALSFMDGRTITDREHFEKLLKMAEDNGINIQLKNATTGGNDAGAVHLAAGGIITASVSIPCRYLHSPVGIIDIGDFEETIKFTEMYIKKIGGIMGWN